MSIVAMVLTCFWGWGNMIFGEYGIWGIWYIMNMAYGGIFLGEVREGIWLVSLFLSSMFWELSLCIVLFSIGTSDLLKSLHLEFQW